MENFSKNYKIVLSNKRSTPIRWRTSKEEMQFDLFQDGTSPAYRDVDGKLWMLCGHERVGHIGVFCGTCLDDLEEVWKARLNFSTGHADFAFNGVRYPEGVKARGAVWPFGLYICPKTHRFFAFFHNETGWEKQGTGYDALGQCYKPRYDSDFRHIGLMHSDDEGQHWTFDRWVLTDEQVCFSHHYNPNGDCALGQEGESLRMGAGDFSLYVEPNGEWMYIFYNVITINVEKGTWQSCDTYVARTRKREDGVMGDFLKYYDGAFCEAGNLGKATPIVKSCWHSRVVYSKPLGKFLMSYTKFEAEKAGQGGLFGGNMEIRASDDMLHWSEPIVVTNNGQSLTGHYVAVYPDDKENPASVLGENTFSVYEIDGGTAMRYTAELNKNEM